jgi:tetratricopeptide (TPR) repeat protein
MSPSRTPARWPAGFPMIVVTALVLAAAAQLRAQAEADWVGKRVVPKNRDFVLRIDDEPVESSRKAIAIYRVERTDDGPMLWLQAEGPQRLNGWAKVEDVIPLERAIDFFTEELRVHPKYDLAYTMRGLVHQDRNELDAAIHDYVQAIRFDPKNASLYCACAGARHVKKAYDQAISDYNEAIRLDPKSALAHIGRGLSWGDKKDYDKAIEDFSEAIWLAPLSLTAYGNRGLAWHFKKEYKKAIVDYDRVIKLDPENALTYIRRALAWKALKAYGKAVADFELAVQLGSKEPAAFDGLAGIRATCPDERFRDGKRAVESATKACELTGWTNASYVATLAAADAESGDFDSAVKWQAKANALYPEAEDRTKGETRLKLYREKTPYRESEP